MALQWKKVQRADADFTGNVTGKVDNVDVADIKSGAAAGATANQDSTATILSGTLTGAGLVKQQEAALAAKEMAANFNKLSDYQWNYCLNSSYRCRIRCYC